MNEKIALYANPRFAHILTTKDGRIILSARKPGIVQHELRLGKPLELGRVLNCT